MPNSGTNQWGAFTTPADGDTTPTYAPTATPTKPSTPPQSPSGSVTGESSTWEFANGELATSYYTSNLVSAAHDGVSFGGGDEPSPALNVAETLRPLPRPVRTMSSKVRSRSATGSGDHSELCGHCARVDCRSTILARLETFEISSTTSRKSGSPESGRGPDK